MTYYTIGCYSDKIKSMISSGRIAKEKGGIIFKSKKMARQKAYEFEKKLGISFEIYIIEGITELDIEKYGSDFVLKSSAVIKNYK